MSDVDPVARRVGENVAELRGRLSQQELVNRLRVIGMPMLKTTLSKLENAERKITVGELVALAIALGVSPNRLLLTPAARSDSYCPLSPNDATIPEVIAWNWAAGEMPLAEQHAPGVPAQNIDEFRRVNRPHAVSVVDTDTTAIDEEIEQYRGPLNKLWRAVLEVKDVDGVPSHVVTAFLNRLAWAHRVTIDEAGTGRLTFGDEAGTSRLTYIVGDAGGQNGS